ncbi:substrate-binding domain-containing protein [Escherichia marmotae]|nr:substrate-binding domain-containing protein [Escherichia marmotae]MED9633821.1 substrate-binding domain-containing protein [Escherichia marmotae]
MRVLAAGSLRQVWKSLILGFQDDNVHCDFGPAGILRERIEAGERCDLFASANMAHPQVLMATGHALCIKPFAYNRLCLYVRANKLNENDDWYSLLNRETLRIGTSTAGCDPAGDYTHQLFENMGSVGVKIRQRAVALVGGRNSLPLPKNVIAAQWLIENDYTDLFIGYASYAPGLQSIESVKVIEIPGHYNPIAIYGFACLTEKARPLCNFLVSPDARAILEQHGFMSSR